MADTKKTAVKAANTKKITYVGPRYVDGIILPKLGSIKPKEWNEQKIKLMVSKHPQLSKYFEEK